VEERWLPNHVIEPTTREKYAYYLSAHIFPVLGPMRMADIFPEHIREWITWMQREGRSAWTIQYCKSSILNAVFTTALNDQVTYIHPCRGVKIPTVPAMPRTIVTPEQFDAIYAALPDADAQLLAETAIETGLRWGELTELRPSDLDLASRMLTVSRKAIELNPEFHADGRRFLVKRYPKDKEYRRLKLSPQITVKLKAHIQARGLDADALLFVRRVATSAPLRMVTDPVTLGLTEPNEAGRQYRHGTLSAYTGGKCRCAYYRRAFADYRARRRAAAGAVPPDAHRDCR
jgi:integrase